MNFLKILVLTLNLYQSFFKALQGSMGLKKGFYEQLIFSMKSIYGPLKRLLMNFLTVLKGHFLWRGWYLSVVGFVFVVIWTCQYFYSVREGQSLFQIVGTAEQIVRTSFKFIFSTTAEEVERIWKTVFELAFYKIT